MSSECATCHGVNADCLDCGGTPESPDVERWRPAPPGECVGCGRKVRNRFTKGKGAACLPCLWRAWGGAAE